MSTFKEHFLPIVIAIGLSVIMFYVPVITQNTKPFINWPMIQFDSKCMFGCPSLKWNY